MCLAALCYYDDKFYVMNAPTLLSLVEVDGFDKRLPRAFESGNNKRRSTEDRSKKINVLVQVGLRCS